MKVASNSFPFGPGGGGAQMDRMNYIPDAIRPFQIELLPVRRAAYGLPAIGSGILGNSASAVISCKWGDMMKGSTSAGPEWKRFSWSLGSREQAARTLPRLRSTGERGVIPMRFRTAASCLGRNTCQQRRCFHEMFWTRHPTIMGGKQGMTQTL